MIISVSIFIFIVTQWYSIFHYEYKSILTSPILNQIEIQG